jgi:hypothetical protein
MMGENYDSGRKAPLYISRRMHVWLIPWLIKLASEVCHLLAEPPLLIMLLIEATCERIRYIGSAEWEADLGHRSAQPYLFLWRPGSVAMDGRAAFGPSSCIWLLGAELPIRLWLDTSGVE